MHIFDLKIEALLFLSAMSRARASRDLNKLFLFCQIGLFVGVLVCLSEFWFVCQNFALFSTYLKI